MSWFHGAAARLRLVLARRSAEAWMDEEIRFHVDMETERLMRDANVAPDEARRRALIAFGGVQGHREALRDGRGLRWLGALMFDLRLGVRMLRKYPGLTTVAVLGIAMAVAFASVMFTLVSTFSDPRLPFPDGDRIVGIQVWDRRAYEEAASTIHDLDTWRQQVSSVEAIGAFRLGRRNLTLDGDPPEPMDVAEMTAAAFRITRVGPFLGRGLAEEDERAGAPPVVVMGYDFWRARLGSNPAIIGRSVRLGRTDHTVVGVMPRDYGFPIAHQIWIPLRAGAVDAPSGASPAVLVVARLAPGTARTAAQAELTASDRRRAADAADRRDALESRVVPFPALVGLMDEEEAGLAVAIPGLNTLLLILICVNVAILVYARTATRQAEIAVRVSLGASRGRIIGQLFGEALVLSSVGSAAGLLVGMVAYRIIRGGPGSGGFQVPFWMPPTLSAGAVVFVVCLTLLAAVIIGVLPARHATGRGMRASLSELGGGASIRLGKAWTAMIVTQVAVAVLVLPEIVYLSGSYGWYSLVPAGLETREYLTAQLDVSDVEAREVGARLGMLEQLVERERGVTGATYSSHMPGYERFVTGEVEDSRGTGSQRGTVRTMAVAPDFFEVLEIPVIDGRSLRADDALSETGGIVVNEAFVREFLDGGRAIGQRARVGTWEGLEQEPWREIVGLVPDFPNRMNPVTTMARVYRAWAPAETEAAVLLVRAPTGAVALGPRLRVIAQGVEPRLQLRDVESLDSFYRRVRRVDQLAALMTGLVTLCVLALSAGGMYALMSVTVTRRRREIGIRSALGAQPGRLVAAVLARALWQLGVGAAAGLTVAMLVQHSSDGEAMGGHAVLVVSAILALVAVTVCLAALGPARRSLRIHPAEALKAE